MPGPPPVHAVDVSRSERRMLKRLRRARQTPQGLVWRIEIILRAAQGDSNAAIAGYVGVSVPTVRRWRRRWAQAHAFLRDSESPLSRKQRILQVLSDAPRPGAPLKFRADQMAQIIALACTPPEESGRPVTHWTAAELADEARKRNIVESISARSVGRLLEEAKLKPHRTRYWMHPTIEDPEAFAAQVEQIGGLYQQAPQLQEQGVHLISTDEKTGIQALERKHPSLPMRPGKVEALEFEYVRHGTQCLIANFEVATGRLIAPSVGETRTEADFLAHIRQTVDTDPQGVWIFVVDQLNTHQSESLVRFVAERCDIQEALGTKGASGILASLKTRRAFLEDPMHRIRFVSTPKHCSWLNQVEIWFSILVRRLLKRGSFRSKQALKQSILAFIAYFNATLAKPLQWTYTGKPLAA